MAELTKIQWCEHTFNPWRGCTKVAAGCANCYAENSSKLNPATLGIWGDEGTRVVASNPMWRQVVKWNQMAAITDVNLRGERPRVFVASLADVFEDWQGAMVNSQGDRLLITSDGEWITLKESLHRHRHQFDFLTMDDVRARLFRLIDECPNLDFLLLTKRPENIVGMWPAKDGVNALLPRHNVWLITSIAEQKDADRNIPHLLKCRSLSPVLGLSGEPLVESIDLSGWLGVKRQAALDAQTAMSEKVDWVIAGGESGQEARPYDLEWARSLRDQCKAACVPFFHKQVGANPWIACNEFSTLDSKGGDPSEWPEDLRVREFPDV